MAFFIVLFEHGRQLVPCGLLQAENLEAAAALLESKPTRSAREYVGHLAQIMDATRSSLTAMVRLAHPDWQDEPAWVARAAENLMTSGEPVEILLMEVEAVSTPPK
ncbi:MAG: hypothetical protein PHT12_04025 [Patescibacteria group bacterium]|nr:hypothetical protein [Patescibacteria group bacterium]